MYFIKDILKDLEHDTNEAENNEYVSETELYNFILKKIDYKLIADTTEYYFMRLASASIAQELIKQAHYERPTFNSDLIIDLLEDRTTEEYHKLYNYYINDISYLEHHKINNQQYFIGEDLKIKNESLIRIFALIISEQLKTAFEKVSKILLDKVSLGEWHHYIFGGTGESPEGLEKEFVQSIVDGVLK